MYNLYRCIEVVFRVAVASSHLCLKSIKIFYSREKYSDFFLKKNYDRTSES